jgi:hypothetical protein
MERNEKVAEQMAAFDAQLDWLTSRMDSIEVGPAVPGRWSWRDASPEAAQVLLTELSMWVDWLVHRYGLDELVPSCWHRHGPMIEELTALYAAWNAAYADAEARGFDPLYWHDGLDRLLARLREWDRQGCRDGAHRDDSPAPLRQVPQSDST